MQLSESELEKLRFPVGKFKPRPDNTSADWHSDISRIESLPAQLNQVVQGLSDAQLATSYRPEGWTIRQVVHHLADSHLHAFIRTKWALTEDNPTIKAYHEKAWASTPDNKLAPEISIQLLEAHHRRWVALFRSLSEADLKRTYLHPVSGATVSIQRIAELYAWHGEHHLAHCRLV